MVATLIDERDKNKVVEISPREDSLSIAYINNKWHIILVQIQHRVHHDPYISQSFLKAKHDAVPFIAHNPLNPLKMPLHLRNVKINHKNIRNYLRPHNETFLESTRCLMWRFGTCLEGLYCYENWYEGVLSWT